MSVSFYGLTKKTVWLFTRRGVQVFGFVLLVVALYVPSGRKAAGCDLESTWQTISEYAAVHGLRYGSELLHNYGPLGYLGAWSGLGNLSATRQLFAVFWALLSVLAVFRLFRGPALVLAWAWLCFGPNPVTLRDQELQGLLIVAMLAHSLFLKSRSLLWEILLAVFLAVLVFIKTSFLSLGFLLLFLVPLARCLQGRAAQALRFPLILAAALAAVWGLAGQQAGDLPAWLRGSFYISRGYIEAMGRNPVPGVFELLTDALMIFFTAVIIIAFFRRREPAAVCFLLLISGMAALQGRHALVRADAGHLLFLTRLLPLLPLLFFRTGIKPFRSGAGVFPLVLFAVLTVLAFQAHRLQSPGDPLFLPVSWQHRAEELGKDLAAPGASQTTKSGISPKDCLMAESTQRTGTKGVDVYN